MTQGTLPNLAAKISDIAGLNQQILPVVRLSAEEVVLMPLGEPLPSGELVEIKLQAGATNLAVLDGEVVGSDQDGHVVIRLMNLDRAAREALGQALADYGSEQEAPESRPGALYSTTPPRSSRRRRKTPMMNERTLDELARASRRSGVFMPPDSLERPGRKGGSGSQT